MIAFICAMQDESSDQEFMIHLYMEFEKLLFYTAHKYVSRQESIEDIVQESLVRLHEKIKTIRPMNHVLLAAYIRSTVRNTAINYLKKMEYEKDHIADSKDECIAMAGQNFLLDTAIDISRYRELLSKIWPQLPREYQILLEGKYILGYSDRELAAEIGCKASSIRMKLTRARRHALTIIEEQERVSRFDEA